MPLSILRAMQTRSRILEDLARVAGGAATTLTGLRQEIDTIVRARLERVLARMDLVTREEFDAVRDMAAKARAEQDRLEERIRALESKASAPKRKTRSGRTKSGQ